MTLYQKHTEQKNKEFISEIERLTTYTSNFNILKKLSEDQQKELIVLSGIQQEKENLTTDLETLQRDFKSERSKNIFLTCKLKEMEGLACELKSNIQSGVEREEKKAEIISKFEKQVEDLKLDIKDKDEKLCRLNANLKEYREEVKS